MCLATKLLDQQILEMETEKKELDREMSRYERILTEFYHRVEIIKFNDVEGFQLAMELQTILRGRRNVKFQNKQIYDLITYSKSNLQKLKQNEKKYFSNTDTYKEYVIA